MEKNPDESSNELKMTSSNLTKTGYKLNLDYCSNCWKSFSDDRRSKGRCGRCGMVTYCSKECQVADWNAKHKNLCNDWTTAMNPQRSLAHINILYNRNFAGLSSVFQWRMFHTHGHGVVVAELSDEPEMFLIPRDRALLEGRTRTISFSFYHTKEQIHQLTLDYLRVCHPNDPRFSPTEEFGLITGAMQTASKMCAGIPSIPQGQFYAMVIKHPSWMAVYLMMNWMSPTHPTLNLPFTPESCNWDREDTTIIVGPKFYEKCMTSHRERAKAKGDERFPLHPRWAKLGPVPPLAVELNMTNHP